MRMLFLLFIVYQNFSFTQVNNVPERLSKVSMVNNFSAEFPNLLNSEETKSLEQKLNNYLLKTSNEIVVIIVDDLKGIEPGDFATNVGNQWGIGNRTKDNGIVLLIKPTGEKGERKTHIAVGIGLEEFISNQIAKEIIENQLIPNFINGKFYTGIDLAIDKLIDKLPNLNR
jgi:uncharacterized protein